MTIANKTLPDLAVVTERLASCQAMTLANTTLQTCPACEREMFAATFASLLRPLPRVSLLAAALSVATHSVVQVLRLKNLRYAWFADGSRQDSLLVMHARTSGKAH